MSIRQQLVGAVATGEIVRVYRESLEDGWVEGYICAIGVEFFAMIVIDKSIRFDGYSCMRHDDVSEIVTPAPYAAFIEKALIARGLNRPETPHLDLSSVHGLLRSAGSVSPLVTIHNDDHDDGVCFIGRIETVTDDYVGLLEVSPAGEWDAAATVHDLEEITRIDFGGGYEEALFLVARS